MKASLGADFPAFLEALSQPPPVSIRRNPAKHGNEFAQSEQILWHPDGRYLMERPVFTLDPSFHAGAYYVQEASSMLLYEALRQTMGIGQPLRVLDLCAAPGGKSTLLLSAIGEGGFLLSNEVIQSRIAPLKMNLEKWGHLNIGVSNHDPADFDRLSGFFDVVLVDAPCSGEGLFRKDKDAASHWSEANVELCAARQQRILAAAKDLVRQGGLLIYSTCTFNAFENEQNVQWLMDNGDFEHESLSLPTEWGIAQQKLGYQCYPHRVKGEGFFMACLRKTGEPPIAAATGKQPKDWQRLTAKQLPSVDGFFAQPTDFEYYIKPQGEVVALPKANLETMFTVASALRKRSIGIEIGELKKQDLVPSHALALANGLHPDLPKADLDKTDALLYLKKENTWRPEWQKGWTLAVYEGNPLGWMKVLDNRSNNYLPMDWRIRMAVDG
jgi:16S rRNA C967 or C1407 C5-methylase (RsmB/RsmF family)/NOL1/NOP2/fmu family ribosome biogenesis protein